MSTSTDHTLGPWNRYWFTPKSAGALGIARIYFFAAMSIMLWEHNVGLWADMTQVVWWPIPLFRNLGLSQVSPDNAALLHFAFKLCLIFSCLGFLTRISTASCTLMALYIVGLPNCYGGKIGHGYTLPLILMGIFAFSDSGAAWSIDNLIRKKFARDPKPAASGRYNWPMKLMLVTFALVFFGAGYSKLYRSGLEWIFSDNFSNLLLMHQYDRPVPLDWGVWIAKQNWLCVLMALMAVVFELGAPLGLINNYLKAFIFGSLLLMQIGIWLLIGVKFTPYFFCYPLLLPWQRVSDFLESLDFSWLDGKEAR